MRKTIFLFTLLMFCALFLSGCRVGAGTLEEAVTVRVSATRDFGKEVLFDRESVIDRRLNAQDVLSLVTEIQMDGSYVAEFEGLRGNEEEYWLYYINGFLSRVFASGYLIRPGDVMFWDYHPWTGSSHGSSAIIGSFPEPLLHGYEGVVKPTVIAYSPEFAGEAGELVERLEQLGITRLSIREESTLTEQVKGDCNLILIAGSESSSVRELNEHYQSLGLYCFFDENRLNVTDYQFTVQEEYTEGAGVIQACQNPWNPLGTGACKNVVFMVSGTDTTGIRQAARILIDCADTVLDGKPSVIRNTFGVIITSGGELIKTPQ